MKTLVGTIILITIWLSSGCVSLPQPEIADSYLANDSYPTIGVSVSDDRAKSKVGTVGLASFKMENLDLSLSKTLRNDLNSVMKINVELDYEKDSRLPYTMDVSIKTCSFEATDAFHDARGGCSVKIIVKDLTNEVVLSETYIVANRMSVEWPSISKNHVIIKDLLQAVSRKIANDKRLRSKIGI